LLGNISLNCKTAGSKFCLLFGKPQPQIIMYLRCEKSACPTWTYLSPCFFIAILESGIVRSAKAFIGAGIP
jgi:hypothetical protein